MALWRGFYISLGGLSCSKYHILF